MSTRELAAIAFRTLAMWLFASGVAGLCSALLTWVPDVAQYGPEPTSWRLAAASIFVPIGALIWLASDAAARMAFPSSGHPGSVSLSRADLYAFASVLVGMFLLSDALTQVVYWIVIWRTSRGTGFWDAASDGSMPNTVVYWVHVRAQVGLVLAKTVLGLGLLLGPERLRAAVMRVRRELSGSLADEEPPAVEARDLPRDGV
jgi:hypothetical protein